MLRRCVWHIEDAEQNGGMHSWIAVQGFLGLSFLQRQLQHAGTAGQVLAPQVWGCMHQQWLQNVLHE